MPVYRCNQCGHVSESPTAGLQVPCGACQTPCQVFDTAFYVRKLVERYFATVRELKLLQSETQGESGLSAQEATESQNGTDNDTYADFGNLATATQHEPIERWLKSRQVQPQFDYSNVDTSGYFDEAASRLGKELELFEELLQRVAWSYRKSHTGLNIDLSTTPQKDIQSITKLCRDLYSHTLFSRYQYQKQEKVLRLSLQPAPKVRQFFEGAWLEWVALLDTIEYMKARRKSFSCARGVKLQFQNEDLHELDVVVLPKSEEPFVIECKTGEFRRDIDKYQRLRRRLGISASRFIVCATDLNEEQATSLSAMYELTFATPKSLIKHVSSLC